MKRYRLPHSSPFDQCGGFHQPICQLTRNDIILQAVYQQHANTLPQSIIIDRNSHPDQKPRRKRYRSPYYLRYIGSNPLLGTSLQSQLPAPAHLTPAVTTPTLHTTRIRPAFKDANTTFTPPAPRLLFPVRTQDTHHHTINNTSSPPPTTHLNFDHTARRRPRIHPPTTSCSASVRALSQP